MAEDQEAGNSSVAGTSGWIIKGLRIRGVYADSVQILDTKGAQHFREFVDAVFDRTARKRKGPHQTRYLEELTATAGPKLLSEECADYISEMVRSKMARSTLSSQKHHFRLLMLAAGDVSIARVNADHIRKFWEIMRWWPLDAGKSHKFRAMTDAEIFAYGKAANGPPRSDSTMELAKTQLAAFFNALQRRQVIGTSPMVGFRTSRNNFAKKGKRRGFRDDELVAIFESEKFLLWARKAPHAWWGPMLGLYTGARVGEIAQLKVDDVAESCGVWCIHIQVTENEDGTVSQRVKGASSIRTIPLAQPLLDAGFLDFVEDARASGHPRLFPQLKLGTRRGSTERNDTDYGQALSRVFSEFLHDAITIEKGLAFHCFRHHLITFLQLLKEHPRTIASITGHTEQKERRGEPVYPVMEGHYTHIPEDVIRREQVACLANFQPPVVLPRYQRGQFAHCYGPTAKMHP